MKLKKKIKLKNLTKQKKTIKRINIKHERRKKKKEDIIEKKTVFNKKIKKKE